MFKGNLFQSLIIFIIFIVLTGAPATPRIIGAVKSEVNMLEIRN